jgi:pimeloyl-ACP methyl ester carboxylesterase
MMRTTNGTWAAVLIVATSFWPATAPISAQTTTFKEGTIIMDAKLAGAATSSTLKVPGATLYYEVQGQGPLLVIIPGGPQDAGVFDELASRLADRYRVVAFDPRGNSRSPFDGDDQPLDVDVHADDVAALIAAFGGGPANVFGSSGGAQIGLNLAARHPALVATLVAHEPPAIMLLDDPSAEIAADQALIDTYRRDGVEAAMGQFFAMNGLGDETDAAPEVDMPPEAMETFARVSGNFEYWLAGGMVALDRYIPDIAALKSGTPRIVVAIGEESGGQPIEAMGRALATKLGVAPARFPGDHMGFEMHAEAFADALHSTLAGK